MQNVESICFDDVLLIPRYSTVESRHNITLKATDFEGEPIIIGDREMELPIFSAPMDTVVNADTAKIMSQAGISPILHRYCTIEEQAGVFSEIAKSLVAPAGVAIGATGDYAERAHVLYNEGCRLFCVDVAHGHHIFVKDTISHLRDRYCDEVFIMAGNVASLEGFDDVYSWGADFVRCGVGGGSVCSTRIVTGHGVPTLQTILDCSVSENDGYVVADGGLRNSGDIVKSFAAGADFVMLGSMLSCCFESPGETKKMGKNQELYKNYRGMASKDAQMDWRGTVSVSEGVSAWSKICGSLENVIEEIVTGVRSGLSYSGVESIEDLYHHSTMRRISQLSILENKPHSTGAKYT